MFIRINKDCLYKDQLIKLAERLEENKEFKRLLGYSIKNNKKFSLTLTERSSCHGSNYEPTTKIILLHGGIEHRHEMWQDFACTIKGMDEILMIQSPMCKVDSVESIERLSDSLLKGYEDLIVQVMSIITRTDENGIIHAKGVL